jgi:hypothetical protein
MKKEKEKKGKNRQELRRSKEVGRSSAWKIGKLYPIASSLQASSSRQTSLSSLISINLS